MTLRSGSAPVVVVAPHGGCRRRPIRRGDGMNDLYTAELALELAERLDAAALINHARDRNDVDLNRVRQLVDRAPQFLSLLRDAVERIHDRGALPLVLFVHGWNMAVPWCDVGIGLRERAGDLFGRYPTVGPPTYRRLVQPLVDRLFSEGLGASIGLRYPAAGGDNATQLFSGRHVDHDHDDVAALSRMGAYGSVDAIQLELGIPLRWPGWRRRRFVDVLVSTVEAERERREAHREGRARPRAVSVRSRLWGLETKPPQADAAADSGVSIQAALADGSGLFMGAEPTGAATMAARLCIALADGSMLLFVGEGPWQGRVGDYTVAGFRWQSIEAAAGCVRVRLHGPVVHYPTHEAFVDLEKGLAAARLLEADIDLDYIALEKPHGRLRGSLVIGELSLDLDEAAVCERGGRRSSAVRPRTRLHLTSGWPRPRSFESRTPDSCEAESGVRDATERQSPAHDCEIRGGDRPGDELVVLEDGEPVLTGTTCVAVPVFRPLADGLVVKITFGTARFDGDGGGRRGVYERVALVHGGAARER
jgi:hypothetical protein